MSQPAETPVDTPCLSRRGERLITERPMPAYIDEHFSRLDDRWDPDTNPTGYVSMCIAENKLAWDLLGARMAECRDVPARVAEYDNMTGSQSFRESLARFLERSVLERPVSPEQVVTLAGSGTVLEMLFYVLADPGDGILVPTPSYSGFWMDLQTRDELTIIPVHTGSETGFRLTTDLLDAAVDDADRPVRALLFTSPNNPLGTVYSSDQIEEIIAWAERREIHLVLDELFALSVYGDVDFVSGAALRPALGDKRHIIWAFSKDFAASGLRCGVLVSENEAVVQAIDGLAYWAAVSGDTQFLLEGLISDPAWVDGFVAENRRRLGAAYSAVTAALDAASIPYLPAQAGFFFLCDVRRFLPEVTWEAEHDLWRWLLDEVNVNLTPGADCHIGEPGFLRLVFSSEVTEAVVAGVDRMGKALANRTGSR
ncbi:MAG: aminotransferase class I/II-fold pyridoxal phosphate-dependent enzyme [Acidimicrobiia bacterium]